MKKRNIDLPLMIVSLVLIIIIVTLLAMFPDSGTELIASIFNVVTKTLGTPLLWFGFIVFTYCCYMAFSRYGKIRLGDAEPEFSMFQYLSMMICAGLGSACVIWSFVEWAYYYSSPAQGIEPMTSKAAEWATAYNFFHWGFTPWAMFVVLAIPVAYAFHCRNLPALRFSVICENMMGNRVYAKPLAKLCDYFFVFCVVGGLSVTLGLGIPVIATGLGKIFGFTPNFTVNIFVTLAIAILFTLSSYVGIEKGMKKLSSLNVYAALVFIMALLFTGPTNFILDEITNGLGIMLQNYVSISLWTDPVNQGGFPEAWTIFFYAFGIVYAALMAIFITKVSRGRTLRQMICSVMFGGGGGCFVFFGINGSFSMNLQLTGQLNVAEILFEKGNSETIIAILDKTVFGIVGIVGFVIITVLFLATTLDSAAYSLSASSTKKIQKDGNTSPMLRLFWCITLALIPLCMNFIGAPLNTLQTITIITSLPFIIVIICMTKGLFSWFREDSR